VTDNLDELNPRDRVVSLERGLAVLVAVGQSPGANLAALAAQAGVSRAAARRILLTLAGLGYVQQQEGGYVVRPKVFEFGYAYLSEQPLTAIAQGHLEALAKSLGEFCSIAVADGFEIVHIMREAPQRFMRPDIPIGSRFPAYPTAQGRVLLAALPPEQLEGELEQLTPTPFTAHTARTRSEVLASIAKVRTAGYAINDQELEYGVRSAAVPIHDRDGKVLAALGTIVNANDTTVAQLGKRALPELQAAAQRISKDLRTAPVSASRGLRRS
jgi:IclR family pca regulon transcriptional regulator